MTPDEIHDYEYELRNGLARLKNDPNSRAQDRRLWWCPAPFFRRMGFGGANSTRG